ncbi:MAG: hypothetical protein PF517_15970 [Salinivirgaceae bacterium]|jgi:hypothetical protein|nr:hypothetical protein [Salinivirgaceae bacterium]
MKNIIAFLTIAFLVIGFSFNILAQNNVYLKVSTSRLHKNKVASSNYELFVNCDNGEMITHYAEPNDFYVFTNRLGEMQAYYPKKNEVVRQQNMLFSSKNDPVYQFFTTQSQDLGLSELGFVLQESNLEDHYLVTEWNPPIELMKDILSVKLVQEDYLPIFVSYVSPDEKAKQKIYFSDWNMDNFAIYPQRITQIDFLPDNDSIISKKTYTDLLIGKQAEEVFPLVSIPSSAKLVKISTK